jgi:hypothetical protein
MRRIAPLPLAVKRGIEVTGAMFALVVTSTLHAQPSIDSLAGPDSTPALLASDDQERDTVLDVDLQQSWSDWKASLKDRTSLDFGFDYIALGYCTPSNPARQAPRDAGVGKGIS